jgi:hypothetical protein
MYLLNLLILLLILINIGVCSYGVYKKTSEKYMNGEEGHGFKEEVMRQFKESQNEGYDIDSSRLINKFSGEGEGETYEDSQDIVKANLSNLYN